jgi:signal transduction histidine kinase
MASLSFRNRILLLVLAVGLLPLALVGLWLNRSAARSGHELLAERLNRAAEEAANDLGRRWLQHRFELLDLAGSRIAEAALSDDGASSGSPDLEERAARLPGAVWSLTLTDGAGEVRWMYRPPNPSEASRYAGTPLLLTVAFPVGQDVPGGSPGELVAGIRISEMLGRSPGAPAAPGMVLALFSRADGNPLLSLPFDPALLEEDRFQWGGETWTAVRRNLREPPVQIVAAAPLAPLTEPFEAATRRGLWVLLGVTLLGTGAAALLTGRLTRSLEQVVIAAEAVAEGDLQQKVPLEREDEVGRVAMAFNRMTESLRHTLRQLAERESLAAVGEFAASLAHEVRNPLSSILVDLQRVEEGLPWNSPLRRPQRRALGEIERLSRTVSGTLALARSGRIESESLDLYGPLRAAAHASRPAFEARGAELFVPEDPTGPVEIRGDAGKLHQLFLNVLLNAAQAVEEGGRARVEVLSEGEEVVVAVHDDGRGVREEERDRIFDPFYSTRSDGTGLGLPTARRIARAHGGDVELESEVGTGTVVHIRLSQGTLPGAAPV